DLLTTTDIRAYCCLLATFSNISPPKNSELGAYLHKNKDVFFANAVADDHPTLGTINVVPSALKYRKLPVPKSVSTFNPISQELWTFLRSAIASLLEYEKPTISLEQLKKLSEISSEEKSNIRYLTGTACSGKTSILKSVSCNGYTIVKRGALGGFDAKA